MSESPTNSSIDFFSEGIEFNLPDQRKTIAWLLQIIEDEKADVAILNYIFGSDDYVLDINKEYLQHDYYTDIITFPLSESPIESDIFISIDRVKENAQQFNKSFDSELLRVIAHGLLHLIGYNDKTEAEQTKMREKEDLCIQLYYSL